METMTGKIPILMYYEIYRSQEYQRLKALTNPAYNTELSDFRKQMAWLHKNKVKTLTVDELLSKRSPTTEKAICLTFDDGWVGNYLYAYPILQEHGFKATFFIATDLIGNSFYMTWEQLKQMRASGMSIQSHTVSHRPLGDMEEREIVYEFSESKKIIEERLSTKVNHLSLPHGHKGTGIWPLAKKIGYQSICTSDVGFHIWDSPDPWLKRVSIGNGISEKRFGQIVLGKNRAIWSMVVAKSFKNTLRSIVGVNTYRKLYRWVYGIR